MRLDGHDRDHEAIVMIAAILELPGSGAASSAGGGG
jgi:hypothetical protein